MAKNLAQKLINAGVHFGHGVSRWNQWWEENSESHEVAMQRIRDRQVRYDMTRGKRNELEEGWWALRTAREMKERIKADKRL